VGNRDIGARGMGNWYSVDTEIKMGKMYAMEIEKSTKSSPTRGSRIREPRRPEYRKEFRLQGSVHHQDHRFRT